MKVQFEARVGANYCLNLRHLHKETYRVDTWHNTTVGWILEEDIQLSIKPEQFEKGILYVRKVCSDPEQLVQDMETRLSHAKTE